MDFPTCPPSDEHLRVAGTLADPYTSLSAWLHIHRCCLSLPHPRDRASCLAMSKAGEPPDGLDESRSLAGKINPPETKRERERAGGTREERRVEIKIEVEE